MHFSHTFWTLALPQFEILISLCNVLPSWPPKKVSFQSDNLSSCSTSIWNFDCYGCCISSLSNKIKLNFNPTIWALALPPYGILIDMGVAIRQLNSCYISIWKNYCYGFCVAFMKTKNKSHFNPTIWALALPLFRNLISMGVVSIRQFELIL